MLRTLVLLCVAASTLATVTAAACCATCLTQTDPKTTNLTYDPLVFKQCSAVLGSICCYDCDFSHGAPSYSSGVTFATNGAAQATVGTPVTLSFNGIARITYDLLAKNQVKSTFVGNLSTQVLPASDGSFALCARTPGTIALRGWGADACRQVTVEYTITVVSGDGKATCDAATVKPAGDSGTGTKPNQPVTPQGEGGGDKPSGGGKADPSDIENCSATRGSVKPNDDGTKFCECVGDWRNPPLCDQYSWTKTIVTVLGAVAAVFSIAFSVRAYVKSKKAEKEARDKELDVASENELETMRISPAKRDGSSAVPSPATTTSQNTKRSPARTPLTATPIRTSGHETTL